jgi:hypothetical protein
LLKPIAVALVLTSLPQLASGVASGVAWAADTPSVTVTAPAAPAGSGTTPAAPGTTPAPVAPLAPASPAPAPPAPSPAAAAATIAPGGAVPPPAATPAAQGAPVTAAPVAGPEPLKADVLPNAGYVPGYRTFQSFTLAPNVPRTQAFPGGITPGFAAPMPPSAWTFKWSGFLNQSFQASIGHRMVTGPDQTSYVFHIPPQTVDEYQSFLGTSTMPGNWLQINASYGTPVVSANVTLSTWNPTEPTTYYQIGSQNFIQNAFLQYIIPPLGDWKLRAQAGYFYTNYGALAQYGLGLYTNTLVALIRGVGEDVVGEYQFSPTWSLVLDEGFMGNRNGKVPDGTIPDAGNGNANPMYPSNWIAHLHAGMIHNGPTTFRFNAHVIYNWQMDDRVQCQSASILVPPGDMVDQCFDNPTQRQFNSAEVPNGHIFVTGLDGTMNSPVWGYLGVGASYTEGSHASTMRGLTTYGGEGPWLVDRWWGNGTYGSGKLYAAGFNWSASLRRILTAPAPARGDAPDVVLTAGAMLAYTTTSSYAISGAQTLDSPVTMPGAIPLPSSVDQFNHRLRWKAALDGFYTISPFVGLGLRVDRVAPTNKDAEQTFWVVAPRVVFHTNWFARENFSLIYGKWFYGSNTHPDASSIVSPDGRLDDQLIALNVNVWW